MSATVTGTVSLLEIVFALDTTEQKSLIKMLTDDLAEDPEKDDEVELHGPRHRVDVEVEVDEGDVMDDLSSWEKRSIWEDLHSEFGEDCDCEEDGATFKGASSYTERELATALEQIWSDRHLLTQDQISRIQAITKEKFV